MTPAQAPSAGLPPALQTILDELEKSDREAQRIAGSLTDTQANWQPAPGAWSIAQCLDHLARANTAYAAALLEAVRQSTAPKKPWPGPIQPGWLARSFIRALEPPPKRKLRAPKKIVPAPQIASRDVLNAFLGSHEAMRVVIQEAAGLDLNRLRFRNPFFGFLRFTVGAGLLVTVTHDRRHLWQAERILESTAFPRT